METCGVHTIDQLNLKSVRVPDEFHQDGSSWVFLLIHG